jgi:hypothetical protein
MIRINGYLHRDDLYDVIRRWMYDQPDPADAARITHLVHFNACFVSRYLEAFAEDVFGGLHGLPLRIERALDKRTIKDAIIERPPYRNERIDAMIRDYRLHPGKHYRETPFNGRLVFAQLPGGQGERYVGASRIKRVRRLAEKAGRRIIDAIFHAIQQRAETLADERARALGVDRTQLLTPPEDMAAEFARAEYRLLEDLRQGRPLRSNGVQPINDVAGIKVLAEEADYERVLDLLSSLPDGEVIEIEPHVGRYNATNVLVRYKPRKDRILARPISESVLAAIWTRNVTASDADRLFENFLRTGEEDVTLEVIVSSYQEMLESEIGRCMHEDRINAQRMKQEYSGPVAKNIEWLVEYLFTMAISPQPEVGELPIKIWNRYLPDYFDEAIKALWGIKPLRLIE